VLWVGVSKWALVDRPPFESSCTMPKGGLRKETIVEEGGSVFSFEILVGSPISKCYHIIKTFKNKRRKAWTQTKTTTERKNKDKIQNTKYKRQRDSERQNTTAKDKEQRQ
jgi:hypothetical protein